MPAPRAEVLRHPPRSSKIIGGAPHAFARFTRALATIQRPRVNAPVAVPAHKPCVFSLSWLPLSSPRAPVRPFAGPQLADPRTLRAAQTRSGDRQNTGTSAVAGCRSAAPKAGARRDAARDHQPNSELPTPAPGAGVGRCCETQCVLMLFGTPAGSALLTVSTTLPICR
jgi:hypothetical protein